MKQLCAQVLKEISEHLERHPMGEFYFGKLAASNPLLLQKLREGKVVTPATLDKARFFVREREARLGKAEKTEAAE
ncbi:hypothetical protein [Shimia thalassica]|mgnify:CR=1 FL=1|nr:hypothetical protein [Shimia thalassica]